MLMLPLPSARELALIPPTSRSLSQMEDLLLLLLGAAVQSDQKQDFIIATRVLTTAACPPRGDFVPPALPLNIGGASPPRPPETVF